MGELPNNQQKYENYRAQSRRLSSALRSGFYLEAVFIEYAIIEDRLESALTHTGAFNPNRQGTITSKLKKLEKLCENKRGLAANTSPRSCSRRSARGRTCATRWCTS